MDGEIVPTVGLKDPQGQGPDSGAILGIGKVSLLLSNEALGTHLAVGTIGAGLKEPGKA
jgi:hypothetical protein